MNSLQILLLALVLVSIGWILFLSEAKASPNKSTLTISAVVLPYPCEIKGVIIPFNSKAECKIAQQNNDLSGGRCEVRGDTLWC